MNGGDAEVDRRVRAGRGSGVRRPAHARARAGPRGRRDDRDRVRGRCGRRFHRDLHDAQHRSRGRHRSDRREGLGARTRGRPGRRHPGGSTQPWARRAQKMADIGEMAARSPRSVSSPTTVTAFRTRCSPGVPWSTSALRRRSTRSTARTQPSRGGSDARGRALDVPRSARHPRRGRGVDGGTRHRSGPPHGLPSPSPPHLDRRDGRTRARREGRRSPRDGRGDAASLLSDRRGARGLRPERQGQPAAPHRGRPGAR